MPQIVQCLDDILHLLLLLLIHHWWRAVGVCRHRRFIPWTNTGVLLQCPLLERGSNLQFSCQVFKGLILWHLVAHIFQSRDNVLFLLGLLVSSHRRGRKSFFQRSVGKLVWQSDSANQVLIHDAERHIRQRRENRHSLDWLADA